MDDLTFRRTTSPTSWCSVDEITFDRLPRDVGEVFQSLVCPLETIVSGLFQVREVRHEQSNAEGLE